MCRPIDIRFSVSFKFSYISCQVLSTVGYMNGPELSSFSSHILHLLGQFPVTPAHIRKSSVQDNSRYSATSLSLNKNCNEASLNKLMPRLSHNVSRAT